MGMFSQIMGKIFGHAPAPATPSTPTTPPPTPAGSTPTPPAPTGSTPTTTGATPTPAQPVDVTAILDGLSSKNSEHLDWRKSIVDLMKLVGMESSLSERKELAHELGYSGSTNDSAAMNVWLHKAVLKKLAENGGKVPADLLD